jgi:lysosomal Pro-X carboxypeptidase
MPPGPCALSLCRRYPHIIAGAVAASAPVGSFPAVPGFNPSAFWDVVARDASPAAGAAPDCVGNTREAFRQLFEAGGSAEGRQQLQAAFRLCEGLQDEAAVLQLAYWAQVRGSGVCRGSDRRMVDGDYGDL